MRHRVLIGIGVVVLCLIMWMSGYRHGENSGARQMARHILNPAFTTDSFVSIVEEERGNTKGWRVTEDGGIEIYKDGVILTWCKVEQGELK